MNTLTCRFLDHISQASDDPKGSDDLILLPKYWNKLGGLASLWDRRERCTRCGWDGNPEHILRVSGDSEEGSSVLFRRSLEIQCICCKMLDQLIQKQRNLDMDRWSLSLWTHNDRPCVRLEDTLFEDDDIEWNFFILHSNGKRRHVSGLPNGLLVSGNTTSDTALSWVQRQLSSCLTSHSRCDMRDNSFLPTRLMHIAQGNDNIRLVDKYDVPSDSRYVALSHCWGTKLPECLTTRANIVDQKNNIPWSSLPKSFQEAVLFTRRLGIHYLWIDSLCIIQRDKEDWLREAGRMFHVYQNAFLTLAASHAEDSSKGLFSSLAPGRQLQLGTIQHDNEKFQLYAQQSFSDITNLFLYDRSEPLFKRAWTFQERLVSPRVLYFTKDELVWECYSTTNCECGFHGDGPYKATNLKVQHINSILNNDSTSKAYIKYLTGLPYQSSKEKKDLKTEAQKTWRKVVQFYSQLQLTNQTDKLLAIGAIAEQTKAIRKSQTYLAGLWSGSLDLDLLWVCKRNTGNQRQRSQEYIAPSWSWASVPGPVDYAWASPIKPNIGILSAECEYVDGNQFGLATGGRIVLCGQAVTCTLRKSMLDSLPSYHVDHPDLRVDDIDISMDYDPLSTGEESMSVQLLRIADTCDFPAPINIMLGEDISMPGERLYIRLGVVSPPGTRVQDQVERRKLREWFDECSETRVYTIV